MCQKLSVRKLTYGINAPYKNCILKTVASNKSRNEKKYIFGQTIFAAIPFSYLVIFIVSIL